MHITIQVDDTEYQGFKSVDVLTTLDTISGSFKFVATTLGTDFFPIKIGQSCIVKVEGFSVITGYIEKIIPKYNAGNHELLIEGRDKTADVIDSSVFDSVEISEKISLKSLIENTLKINKITDIKVINNVADIEDFEIGDISSSEVNQTLFEFFKSYASKKRVFLITDGLGNIVINRSTGIKINQEILNIVDNPRSNVLSGSPAYDYSQRFNTYEIKSQLSTTGANASGGLFDTKNIVDQKNTATDSEIRGNRRLVIIARQATNSEDLGKLVQWEANIRRIESSQYTCEVQGHLRESGSEIWRPDLLVKVQDDFADIDDILLIKSCRYTFDNDTGSKTELLMVDQDAYKEQAEKPIAEKKSSNLGGLFK